MQSRSDRDKWVTIMMDNIQKDKQHNFFKKSDTTETYNVPYDPYSIMHYPFDAFAIDKSKPTIKSKVSKGFVYCLRKHIVAEMNRHLYLIIGWNRS